ncbi:MAG: ABC transporter ATP-binding protein [Alcaligenaceae bacterium]
MIRLEHIHKIFRSRGRTVHVIDDITQTIPDGSFFTLLGPSGCGKTTTLRVIAGLERHDAGEVWFDEALISAPEKKIFTPTSARDIGMVFQSYAIWPHMDVFDNVAYPLTTRRRRFDKNTITKRVTDTIELVGLGALLHAPSTALSGGQQQRVALARALVAQPKVLLLDEPLSNLDALLRERMRGELTQLQRRLGVTSVYVTHDRAEALSMSDYIAVMNAGRIEMTGTPTEIYTRPATMFVAQFLGHCNFIDGTVRIRNGDRSGIAHTAFGSIKINMLSVPAVGESIKLLIRPEDFTVTTGSAPDSLTIHAGVNNVMYFGEHYEADAIVGEQRLRFKINSTQSPASDTVTLTLKQASCWAFAGKVTA